MSDFKITVPIVRAYKDENGDMIIVGVASTPDLDSHETIFNENCQEGFEIDVNTNAGTDDPVVIEVEHLGEMEPINHLGALEKANVTKDSELEIRGKLDPKNPKAVYYFDVMTNPDPKIGRPKKLGLSINGVVEEAHWEYNADLGKQIRVFDRVVLKKVGIVRAPSNPNTWVEKLVRSYNWSASKENTMEDNQITQDEVTSVTTTEEVTEVRDEVTETDVTTEEVVANNGGSEAEVAETETRADETVIEPAVEVAEEAPIATEVEQTAETTERSEEVTETQESVERTSMYAVTDVLVAVANLGQAMRTLEWYADYKEWDNDGTANIARNVLKGMNTQIPALLTLLGTDLLADTGEETRALDTTNTETHEDLEEDEKDKEETKRTEEVVVETQAPVVDVDSIVEVVRAKFADELATLTNKLADAETANKELQDRIERMEKEPTSTPGGQMLNTELVTRQKTASDKRQEAIARAKETGDAHELTKLLLDKRYQGKY